MTAPARRACATALGLVLLGASVPLAAALSRTSAWATVDRVVGQQVQGDPGVWRAMRGGLAYLAISVLFVLGALVVYALWRTSRRRALAYAVTGLLANLTVQGVKHGVLPGGHSLNPLSGHVGIAAAVCLGWLAFSPRRARGDVWAVGAVVAGVSGGVVLASWHTVPQVLCPLGIVTGWVLLGIGVVDQGAAVAGPEESLGSTWPALLAAGVGGAGLGIVVVCVASRTTALATHPWGAVALAEVAIVAATALATGTVLLARPPVLAPDE